MSTESCSEESWVDDLITGDRHPFPLPPDVMEKVAALRPLIRDHTLAKERPTFTWGGGGPQVLNAWSESLDRLEILFQALDKLDDDMVDHDSEHYPLFLAIRMSLERELIRQNALLEWSYLTCKYDPYYDREEEEQEPPRSSGLTCLPDRAQTKEEGGAEGAQAAKTEHHPVQ